MDFTSAVHSQIPYWIAVLTPEERPLGTRRTDSRIDTVDTSVVTTTRTQWAGSEHPSTDTLLAVLASTVGAWQSNRCRSSTSGVLVDISDINDINGSDGSSRFFPVRLPSTGDPALLVDEVRRRIAAAPSRGRDYAAAKTAPALAKRSGAQIAFGAHASDAEETLHHSLAVTCEVIETDGVTFVDTAFQWNCRLFTRSDVDDFERFWEKTISTFV